MLVVKNLWQLNQENLWDKRVLNKGDENFSKSGKQIGFIAQKMEEAMEGENKELSDLIRF